MDIATLTLDEKALLKQRLKDFYSVKTDIYIRPTEKDPNDHYNIIMPHLVCINVDDIIDELYSSIAQFKHERNDRWQAYSNYDTFFAINIKRNILVLNESIKIANMVKSDLKRIQPVIPVNSFYADFLLDINNNYKEYKIIRGINIATKLTNIPFLEDILHAAFCGSNVMFNVDMDTIKRIKNGVD
jgi:hypothetical protein